MAGGRIRTGLADEHRCASAAGADTVDVPFVAYAVTDTQGRCFLGALTRSPQDDSIFALVVPGVSYRECTSAVAADEFGAIVGTIHGDQP